MLTCYIRKKRRFGNNSNFFKEMLNFSLVLLYALPIDIYLCEKRIRQSREENQYSTR